jgi:hypothetical protein
VAAELECARGAILFPEDLVEHWPAAGDLVFVAPAGACILAEPCLAQTVTRMLTFGRRHALDTRVARHRHRGGRPAPG